MSGSDEVAVLRGEAVKQFLENEHIVTAFAELDAEYMADLRAGQTTADREAAHSRLLALEGVQDKFRRIIAGGERATIEIARRTPKPRANPSK